MIHPRPDGGETERDGGREERGREKGKKPFRVSSRFFLFSTGRNPRDAC